MLFSLFTLNQQCSTALLSLSPTYEQKIRGKSKIMFLCFVDRCSVPHCISGIMHFTPHSGKSEPGTCTSHGGLSSLGVFSYTHPKNAEPLISVRFEVLKGQRV